MVDTELVEHGGVEVVDGDGVLGDAVAEVIGGAPGGAALDAGAGGSGEEGIDVLVNCSPRNVCQIFLTTFLCCSCELRQSG